MLDAPCQFPRCRQPSVVIYLNRDLCCEHWKQLANAVESGETALLAAIDLERTAMGEVMEVATR